MLDGVDPLLGLEVVELGSELVLVEDGVMELGSELVLVETGRLALSAVSPVFGGTDCFSTC